MMASARAQSNSGNQQKKVIQVSTSDHYIFSNMDLKKNFIGEEFGEETMNLSKQG
jgi:hypothetical protein